MKNKDKVILTSEYLSFKGFIRYFTKPNFLHWLFLFVIGRIIAYTFLMVVEWKIALGVFILDVIFSIEHVIYKSWK